MSILNDRKKILNEIDTIVKQQKISEVSGVKYWKINQIFKLTTGYFDKDTNILNIIMALTAMINKLEKLRTKLQQNLLETQEASTK